MSIESKFRFIENVLKTMGHLELLKPGIVKAITFAANNHETVQLTDDEYADVILVFQNFIPAHLIDPNQWWLIHYLSSGLTCSKCLEIFHSFPCAPMTERSFDAITQSMAQGHDDDCSARNAHSFLGVAAGMALHGLNATGEQFSAEQQMSQIINTPIEGE
ncbi:MAG TPA: hypothetical protein VIZ65_00330 [Cellvibrionaceae bacterium]